MNATSLSSSRESMVDYITPSIQDYPTGPICHHHDHGQMRTLARRKESFRTWPLTHITGEELAEAGFFYLKHGDAVECAYCQVQVGKWEHDDDPIEEHRKWSPNCPFLRRLPRTCSYETDSRVEVEKDFGELKTRLETYTDWPPALEQTPMELANAGFYYTGVSDKVICFSCGVGMYAWEKGDVPLKEHARLSKNCGYLIKRVGLKYIQEANDEIPEEEGALEKSGNFDSGFHEELREEERINPDGELQCKICYDKPRSILLLPCQHVCACVECSVKLDRCPICRKPFESFIKTILK